MFDQCWANGVDGGPPLVKHWVELSCFAGKTGGEPQVTRSRTDPIRQPYIIQARLPEGNYRSHTMLYAHIKTSIKGKPLFLPRKAVSVYL